MKERPDEHGLLGFRPFKMFFHPRRYGVQQFRAFSISVPFSLQSTLHNFLDRDHSLAQCIHFWAQRMVYSFSAPMNLILSVLTDFAYVNCLCIIEAMITDSLGPEIHSLILQAREDHKGTSGSAEMKKQMALVRKQYWQELQQLRDRIRFPAGMGAAGGGGPASESGSTSTAKAHYDAKMQELTGGDEISFQKPTEWLGMDKEQKELFDMAVAEKVIGWFLVHRRSYVGGNWWVHSFVQQ